LFKVRKKKVYGLHEKEHTVYAVSDKSKTPRFLIYNDEKEEFEWVWASMYEPVM